MQKIVVIAGLSGGGKTTVATELVNGVGGFEIARSITTRAPRRDGLDGEYIYVGKSEFAEYVNSGETVEHTSYAGVDYATTRTELKRIIDAGNSPVLILDFNGVRALKSAELPLPVVSFYIYSDLNDTEARLYARELATSPSVTALATYQRRVMRNIGDYLEIGNKTDIFDAFVKNETVRDCALEILAYLSGEKACQAPDEKKKIAEELSLSAIRKQ